ncbi:hypothetical protein DN402_05740 [Streptomyces sp. SW4]|nr:hypothetical protein DN402_05740 [Streptomyces sp. SW4]
MGRPARRGRRRRAVLRGGRRLHPRHADGVAAAPRGVRPGPARHLPPPRPRRPRRPPRRRGRDRAGRAGRAGRSGRHRERTAGAAPVPAGRATPLAPVQAWFFRHIRTDLHQWNQSVLLELSRAVDPTTLRLALQAVVAAHPALSARFAPDPDASGTPDAAARLMVAAEPFAAYPPQEVLWERDIAEEADFDRALEDTERSLDPLEGVHVRAVLVHDRRSPAAPAHLLIAVHHLVVDGVSWRILLEDLEHALTALAGGVLPALPAEACRYEDWVASLPAVAARDGEADHWRGVAAARASAHTLLLTTPAPNEEHIRRVEFSLDPEATARLIGPLPARLGLEVHQVMTGAFAQALARWRGTRTVTFDVETHGRHGRDDLFRTVGWFTSIHPLVLGADRALPPEDYLAAVGADLTAVPDGGVGFGACREFSPDAALRDLLRELPPALVCFNYYGQADQLSPSGGFTMSPRPIPREHSARCERVYGIEVYGIVHGGRLRMGLTWVPSPADGVDEAGVDALVAQMAWVLATLAGADPAGVAPAEIPAPGTGAPRPAPARPPCRPRPGPRRRTAGRSPCRSPRSSTACSSTRSPTAAPAATWSSCSGAGTAPWTPTGSPRPGSRCSTGRPSCAPPSTGRPNPAWCCTTTSAPRSYATRPARRTSTTCGNATGCAASTCAAPACCGSTSSTRPTPRTAARRPRGSCSPSTTCCWTAGACPSCSRSSTAPTSPAVCCPAANGAPTSATTPAGWPARTPRPPASSGPRRSPTPPRWYGPRSPARRPA